MKLQNERRKKTVQLGVRYILLLIVAAAGLYGAVLGAHAQGTAVVSTTSAKIRESADTTSKVMASVKKDDKLDVISQTTSADGYTWYKVYVDGSSKGYIRADLVNSVEGTISKETAAQTTDTDTTTKKDTTTTTATTTETKKQDTTTVVGSKNTTTEKEESEEAVDVATVEVAESTVAAAKVTGSSVRVRETPSTSGKVKGNAKSDTEVTVSGETKDSDGKTWYQVSFNDGDSTITGFIRSDFLEVTENVEPTTEEATEEATSQEAQAEVNQDYALKYETNSEGNDEWYLYDNLKGTKQSLTNIYALIQQSQDQETEDGAQLQKLKIVLIIMAAIILLLIIAVTVLLFKMKDSYASEYDDDDDDEEEIIRRSSGRKKKLPVRRKRHSYRDTYEDDEDDEEDEEDDEDEDDEYGDNEEDEEGYEEPEAVKRPVRKGKTSASTGKSPKKDSYKEWQSKNFLETDDDMEFEFLDIK